MPDDKNPPGGLDKTQLGKTKGTRYTVRITFHSAANVPVSDINTGNSDPFVLAQINTDQRPRHNEDPHLRFRSKTIHRSTEPVWNSVWVVAGIPESGFELKARLYDSDDYKKDDRLGTLHYHTGRLGESWPGVHEEEFKLRKSGAHPLAYGLRWCTSIVRSSRNLNARMTISIELLGKTEGEDMGKAYTINNFFFTHYSPLIGKIAGTKDKDEQGIKKSDFQSNEMQLTGPVPNELYHRYVEFKSFVGGMFQGSGLRGRVLNKALHHQHQNIYAFTNRTEHGYLESDKEKTLRFLRMAHFDQGGRIFTYVLTLDGLLRFCETGPEFGIDLLSKHTMHSDVNIYIAFSGEFLIRRLAKPDLSAEADEQQTHPADEIPDGPPSDSPPEDPKYYELIIDNDSGTYRPDAGLLPTLQKFLEANFPGLHIVTKACDDDELKKIKEDQAKTKEQEGDHMVFGQGSDSSSISSSDESDLEERAQGKTPKSTFGKAFAAVENPNGTAKGAFKKKSKKHNHHHGQEKEAVKGNGLKEKESGVKDDAQTQEGGQMNEKRAQ